MSRLYGADSTYGGSDQGNTTSMESASSLLADGHRKEKVGLIARAFAPVGGASAVPDACVPAVDGTSPVEQLVSIATASAAVPSRRTGVLMQKQPATDTRQAATVADASSHRTINNGTPLTSWRSEAAATPASAAIRAPAAVLRSCAQARTRH